MINSCCTQTEVHYSNIIIYSQNQLNKQQFITKYGIQTSFLSNRINIDIFDNKYTVNCPKTLRSFLKETKCEAIVYFINSTDSLQLQKATTEIETILSVSALQNAILLIYAINSDQQDASSANDIKETLKLSHFKNTQKIQCCSAKDSDKELDDGMQWLSLILKSRQVVVQ
ncbi:Conserved_hypothetical protein [Hexamita inflata]|uniref:Uncharacterized protein n=1 Tax=Hexamita inflata TaxID=28002 RepID=A0AA86Q8A8_9EUKA|nr:Conserved hypothetical protein [Hexamita inflata]